MAKKSYRFGEVADCGGQGHAGSAGWSGARSGADQHHGVLQAVQREDQRKELDGLIIPVVVSVYTDRTFTFITKTPPAAILLKRAAGVAKGSGTPNKDKVGKVTEKQVLEIAKQKMPDLNAASVEAAVKSVKGTARSMGIEVTA